MKIQRYDLIDGEMVEREDGEYIRYSDHKELMDIYQKLDFRVSSLIDSYLGTLLVHSWFDKKKFDEECKEICKLRDIVNPGWRD